LRLLDWGLEETRVYLVTDPPRGISLRQLLDVENVDLRRALDLARQLARGLMALHALSLADIDLRPQFITVDRTEERDRAQIDDVGLRLLLRRLGYVPPQELDDIASLDPRYASPEHLQNGQIGPWSDAYQLGLLIFELVAGRLPFVGRNLSETVQLQCNAPVPRVEQFVHDAPPALQNLIEHALAKNPAQRYPSIAAMLTDLDALSQAVPSNSTAASVPLPAAAMNRAQTSEMDTVQPQEDATLRATLIARNGSSQPTVSDTAEMEPGALAYLAYEGEGGEPQRFPITSAYVIVGRRDPKRDVRPDIDLTRLDPRMTISRQHARIRYENQLFYIEDLKSRNKTRLGELTLTPLNAELLQHGDVLHFGSVRVIFRVPGKKDTPPLKG
jgi:serine/threonine protein kinase